MPRKKRNTKRKKAQILLVLGIFAVVGAFFTMLKTGDIVFVQAAWKLFANIWWIILPIPMWNVFLSVWDEYVGLIWTMKQEKIILEIRPPSELEKSPKIMEQIFNGLHTFSAQNKFEIFCGWRAAQDRFSFEIVSTEGAIHFYVRCPKVARNNVEAQIYAQYPEAEIFETEDYVTKVPMNLPNKEWDVWGSTMKLVKDDPIPIRTYMDFKEDVTGKMVDPLSSLTEVFGMFGKDQHAWLQVIFSPAGEGEWYPKSEAFLNKIIGKEKSSGGWKNNPLYNFFQEIGVLFGNIFRGMLGGELVAPEGAVAEERVESFNINNLTPGEQETLKAIHVNMSKPAFNTTMRYVYLGKREVFNKALGVAGPLGAIKQFADVNLNAIFPDPRSKTFANYYYTESRLSYRQRRVLQEYRDRSTNMGSFIFNTEELATVFHFPDMSVMAPTIQRVEAKKGEAPANLPIDFESSMQ
jgi:hypothetical protein